MTLKSAEIIKYTYFPTLYSTRYITTTLSNYFVEFCGYILAIMQYQLARRQVDICLWFMLFFGCTPFFTLTHIWQMMIIVLMYQWKKKPFLVSFLQFLSVVLFPRFQWPSCSFFAVFIVQCTSQLHVNYNKIRQLWKYNNNSVFCHNLMDTCVYTGWILFTQLFCYDYVKHHLTFKVYVLISHSV